MKKFVSCLIDSSSPLEIKYGIGKEIQSIRPNNQESNRIIEQLQYEGNIYRIDYGKNTFCILFGLSNTERMAHILGITKHETYSGKETLCGTMGIQCY